MEEKTGGYKKLDVFIQSEIIYDFTVEFVKRYINPKSRTCDQMEQGARSGKQNIPEGYMAGSMETRLKLLKVARGSLEELLNDYLDYLRQHGLELWDINSPMAKDVRGLVYNDNKSYNDYKCYIENAESACNAMVCLINQTNMMLDKKIR